jgi:hypothetical protein
LERGVPKVVVVVKLARSRSCKDRRFPALPWHEKADDIDFGTIESRVIRTAEQIMRTRIRVHKGHT